MILLFLDLERSVSGIKEIHVLLTPLGELSADGQLRESFTERRARLEKKYSLWYLTPKLLSKFGLRAYSGLNYEAVAALDPALITWLKLRFGGNRICIKSDVNTLWKYASELPPLPIQRNIALLNVVKRIVQVIVINQITVCKNCDIPLSINS